MKALLFRKIFIILFLLVSLTINAQLKNNSKITNENTEERITQLSNDQVTLVIDELVNKSDNVSISKKTARAVISLKIDNDVCQGLSYKLYNNSGVLIKSNPIVKTTTTILLHNAQAENYVLNIIKGKESVKTFGFYH